MATTNELVIESLNRLLAVCKGSEQGFRAAADAVKDRERRAALKKHAHQRARLASELRIEIRLLGGEPETLDGITTPPGLSRLIAAASQQNEQTVLAECGRMETLVCRAFESALADPNLPVELQITLRRQYLGVHDASAEVQRLNSAGTAPAQLSALHSA